MEIDTKCLSDVCEIISSPVNKKSNEGESQIRLCNYTDVYYNDVITNDMDFMVATASDREISKFSLQPGDVIITKDSESPDDIAVPALVGECVENLICGYHLIIVRPNVGVSGGYLNHLFNTKKVRREFFKVANGATRYGLPIGEVKNLKINLPSLEEQRKIAACLSTWDKAIDAHDRLIELETQKRDAFIDSAFAALSCPTVALGDISTSFSGGTPKSSIPDYYGDGFYWVSIADMTKQGKYISRSAKSISTPGLKNSSAKIYPTGTVLFAMYASIGEVAITKCEVTSSQAILGIQCGDRLNSEYLYYRLLSMRKKLLSMGQQGTQSNLNAGMVRDLRIPLPDIKKQREVATIAKIFDEKITLLTKKSTLLKQQKQGLMQQLLA
jgi:type I restriction enzyme S subunit